MFSFDVHSLFTSIPIEDCIRTKYFDNIYIFLNHLNSIELILINNNTQYTIELILINNNTQYTIELQANNSLVFLDGLVIRNPNDTICHTVYIYETHAHQ